MTLVRCLVADDHPALTAATTSYLEAQGYAVVGPAADGRRALELAEAEQPELAVVDYRMPRLSQAELVRKLRAASPQTRIVVYTADADEQVARDALGAGAAALVLKEAPLAELVRALEAALAGDEYLDPAVGRTEAAAASLTPRELDVLALLAEGLRHEEIGSRLGISSETVRTHVRKACGRLEATTRTQAVATALRLGLIS